jgi:hypothetical protein
MCIKEYTTMNMNKYIVALLITLTCTSVCSTELPQSDYQRQSAELQQRGYDIAAERKLLVVKLRELTVKTVQLQRDHMRLNEEALTHLDEMMKKNEVE